MNYIQKAKNYIRNKQLQWKVRHKNITISDTVYMNAYVADKEICNVTFNNCTFNNCDFHDTRFIDCTFNDCQFKDCDLKEAYTYNCTAKAVFCDCNMELIILKKSNFSESKFENSNIQNAKIFKTNMTRCYVDSCDMRRTTLADSCFTQALFTRALLWLCYVRNVDFQKTTFSEVYMLNACFEESNFSHANIMASTITDARITKCSFDYVTADTRTSNFYQNCPEEGSFIAWKKTTKYDTYRQNDRIIKLLIPEDAKRSSSTTRKCRASKAVVLDITDLEGKNHYETTKSSYFGSTVYKVGHTVYPDGFDDDRWNECSHGIHFFLTRQEAIDY